MAVYRNNLLDASLPWRTPDTASKIVSVKEEEESEEELSLQLDEDGRVCNSQGRMKKTSPGTQSTMFVLSHSFKKL